MRKFSRGDAFNFGIHLGLDRSFCWLSDRLFHFCGFLVGNARSLLASLHLWTSGTGFSQWILDLGWTNPHRLKSVLLKALALFLLAHFTTRGAFPLWLRRLQPELVNYPPRP